MDLSHVTCAGIPSSLHPLRSPRRQSQHEGIRNTVAGKKKDKKKRKKEIELQGKYQCP